MSSQIGGHCDSREQRLSAQSRASKAGQIRELYEQLLGITGPDCVIPSKGNASKSVYWKCSLR